MKRVVSATEARVHFGELLRQVVQSREAIIVERDGKPQVVILDLEQYEQLKAAQPQSDWQLTMEKALDLARQIRASRGGQPLPEPAEVIRQVREERNEQLRDTLPWVHLL